MVSSAISDTIDHKVDNLMVLANLNSFYWLATWPKGIVTPLEANLDLIVYWLKTKQNKNPKKNKQKQQQNKKGRRSRNIDAY